MIFNGKITKNYLRVGNVGMHPASILKKTLGTKEY